MLRSVSIAPRRRHVGIGDRVGGVRELQRLDNPVLDFGGDAVMRHRLDHHSEKDIVRVAVVELCSGREQRRLIQPFLHPCIHFERNAGRLVVSLERGKRIEIQEAAAHFGKLAQSDMRCVRHSHRQFEFVERVIDLKLSLIGQLQHHRNNEGFGVAADPELVVDCHGFAGSQIGDTKTAEHHASLRVPNADHRTGHRRFAAISLELRIYCGGDGSLRRHRQWMFRLCGPQGRNSQQGRGHSNSRAQHEMHHEIAQPLRHTTSYNTNRRGDNDGLLSLCRMVSLNG